MNEKFISPNNLSSLSDVIFSEDISIEHLNSLNKNNIHLIKTPKNEIYNSITYKVKSFTLKENDLIYCHRDFVIELFNILKKVNKLKNLKLITHQSDKPLTNKIIKMRPSCVSQWYSLNLDEENLSVESIPFGLSNKMSKKNLTYVKEIPKNLKIDGKNLKLYVNFRKSTNREERGMLYEYFQDFDWVVTKNPELSLEEYEKDLKENLFVLCPWGNGVDTHRLWETLYSGSIPITKKHDTFREFNDLPIVQVDSYKDINYQMLRDCLDEIKNKEFNFNKLNALWWIEEIKKTKVNSEIEEITIVQNYIVSNFWKYKYKTINFLESKLKKIKYLLFRINKNVKKVI